MAQLNLIKQFKIMHMAIITSFGRNKKSFGVNCFDPVFFLKKNNNTTLDQQLIFFKHSVNVFCSSRGQGRIVKY